jgi:hypothetical protein
VVDDDAHDPELLAARDLVALEDDGAAGEPTRVDVRFGDGTLSSTAIDVNTPDRDLSHLGARLAEKFDRLASPVLGEEEARRLRAGVVAAGPETSVTALMGMAAGGVLSVE